MYEVLLGYNQNMWIDTEPTGSHGFSVMDEEHVCDWMSQFTLISNPDNIHINLDEPNRAYWAEAVNQIDSLNFSATKNLNNIEITTEGGIVQSDIINNILWLSYYGLPPYELPISGNFTLNINLEQVSGDINQDGTCNVLDIILMINHILGSEELTDVQLEIADLNQNDILDVMDIVLAINIIIEN